MSKYISLRAMNLLRNIEEAKKQHLRYLGRVPEIILTYINQGLLDTELVPRGIIVVPNGETRRLWRVDELDSF